VLVGVVGKEEGGYAHWTVVFGVSWRSRWWRGQNETRRVEDGELLQAVCVTATAPTEGKEAPSLRIGHALVVHVDACALLFDLIDSCSLQRLVG
jgi:hypothetical protein